MVAAVLLSAGVLAAFLAARELVKPLNFTSGISRTSSSTLVIQIGSKQLPYDGPSPAQPGEMLFCNLNWGDATVVWPVPKSKHMTYGGGVAVGTTHTAVTIFNRVSNTSAPTAVPIGDVPPQLDAAVAEYIEGIAKGKMGHGSADLIARTLRSPGGSWVEWDRTALARWGAVWFLCYWPIPVLLIVIVDALAAWALIRARRRVLAGHCACGYDRAGLAPASACPECGSAARL